MTITLELAPEVEIGLNEKARGQGKAPQKRNLTAVIAIEDDVHDYNLGKQACYRLV